MINDAIIPMGRLRFGSFTSSAEVANISKPVKANKIAAPPVKPHLNRMVRWYPVHWFYIEYTNCNKQ